MKRVLLLSSIFVAGPAYAASSFPDDVDPSHLFEEAGFETSGWEFFYVIDGHAVGFSAAELAMCTDELRSYRAIYPRPHGWGTCLPYSAQRADRAEDVKKRGHQRDAARTQAGGSP